VILKLSCFRVLQSYTNEQYTFECSSHVIVGLSGLRYRWHIVDFDDNMRGLGKRHQHHTTALRQERNEQWSTLAWMPKAAEFQFAPWTMIERGSYRKLNWLVSIFGQLLLLAYWHATSSRWMHYCFFTKQRGTSSTLDVYRWKRLMKDLVGITSCGAIQSTGLGHGWLIRTLLSARTADGTPWRLVSRCCMRQES